VSSTAGGGTSQQAPTSSTGSPASRLGFTAGTVVQELGWDNDTDDALRVSVEDAIDDMTHRIGSRDLHWISLVARVQHQAGGNMAEMFDIVAETVRARHRLRGQVRALTAQGRMTRWVLTIAPFALGGLLVLLSPFYINGFLGSTPGRVMIAGACCLIVVGSLWLKKIVEIEV